MIAYASRTGTKRNLAALRENGWRLMVSATGVLRTEGFPYAIDNGAWTAYQRGEPFDAGLFSVAVAELGDDADFIVVPDKVSGGMESLRLSESWLPRLENVGTLLLLPVQEGMHPANVRPLVSRAVGIFVGGGDPWKEHSLPMWSELAAERGAYLHVGRVNTARRIRLCDLAGADSFDGTSVTRFAKTIHRLDAMRRQGTINLGGTA